MKACLSYRSEPTIVISKPPVVGNLPKNLCCTISSESLASSVSFTQEIAGVASTPLKISNESDAVCQTADKNHTEIPQEQIEVATDDPKDSFQARLHDHDATFEHVRFVPLSPLHIDSTLFEKTHTSVLTENTSPCAGPKTDRSFSLNCSRLIDALDIQSPVAFRPDNSITIQSTPHAALERAEVPSTSRPDDSGERHGERPGPKEPPRTRVAEHVQRFNKLTLQSPKDRSIRAPLTFQRTPVRQSVRRFNSMERRSDARSGWCATGHVMTRAASLESQAKPFCPAILDKSSCSSTVQRSANAVLLCALGDVTNTAGKAKNEAPKNVTSILHQTVERAYRGSPRNPITQGKLLSAMKPIDL